MVRVIEGEEKQNRKTQALSDRLTHMREKDGEEYTARLAAKLGLPYADLHIVPLSSDDVFTIPENIANELNVICYRRRGRKLTLGSPSPDNDRLLTYIKNLEEKKGWQISLAVISPASLSRGILQYKHVYFVDALDSLRLSLTNKDLESFDSGVGRLLVLKDQSQSLSTTEILTIIFAGAITLEASDVHIEPQKNEIRLRYRIDGVLQDIITLPYSIYKTILSRIKLMSGMMINIRDEAQDGRFSFDNGGSQVDMRVSTIPGKNAEGIVLRVLKNSGINTSLESLGIVGKAYEDLEKALTKTDGIILTTGPTGSGKTTTLYTIINHINSPETKVITIENPIEYEFDGIVQTEVSKSKDYTFSKALRAIVRQDPDIILVGEIRDDETADVAVNAALTGHLVLSTLHTNGAIATISRLMELGVRPTLIPPAADIFLAQRLVRKLCSCKEEYIPAESISESILKMIALISPKAKVEVPTKVDTLYRPVGCEKCHGTGYKGRIGIFEALSITESVEKLILDMAGETEITKVAIEDGFITIAQDGILKALSGTTSIDEVWRVTSESGIIQDLYEELMSQSLSKRLLVTNEHQEHAVEESLSMEKISQMVAASQSDETLPLIFASGTHLRASDIHIEPSESEALVRLRIDGVLQTIATLTLTQFQQLLAQVKVLSDIPTTTRQGVSDSRFGVLKETTDGEGTKIDVRVSIIVGGFGETIVMRILSSENTLVQIDALGINPYNLERIMSQAHKPYGMILNTGPTGSGKTTTLYSILNAIKSSEIKIITIEDPIEYQIDGILQTQINKEEGYDFAKALRALMRQDPDVILVGEIRDNETAETAVNAAQTGHLLLSTLHTNNAASTVQRLDNLGVGANDLTSSVNAIIAQRLVRKLCSCKVAKEPSEQELALIEKTLTSLPSSPLLEVPNEKKFYSPGSCPACNGIGFKGRTVVSEVIVMSVELSNQIARGALLQEIIAAAKEGGMLTMEQDGLLKALSGETTLEEVKRTTKL